MKAKQSLLVDKESTQVREVLEQVQEELEDHRQSINENTDELQSNYAYLASLENKIDKLHATVEELILIVKGKKEEKKYDIKPLTKREKEVFQALYILGETKAWVSYRELARKLCTTDSLVAGFITNLVEKGVPIKKKHDSKKVFVQFEILFREKQAKNVVIGLNSLLSHWIQK